MKNYISYIEVPNYLPMYIKPTFTVFFCILFIATHAQLTGIKQIPGDYATLELAIQDLNNQGVGASGVIINLQQDETAPNGGYLLGSIVLNSSSNALSPIRIQGNNHILSGGIGISLYADAIFRVAGTDYVTLDGIQLIEHTSNTTKTTQMERGIWLCSLDSNDAPQHCTINDCTIQLNGQANNTMETGILANSNFYYSDKYMTILDTLHITNSQGKLKNLIITNCHIMNCMYGISIIGRNSSNQNSIEDIRIGGMGANEGNELLSIGSESGVNNEYGMGISFKNSTNDSCINNTINIHNNLPSEADLYGIHTFDLSGNLLILGNDISISSLNSTYDQILVGIITTYHTNTLPNLVNLIIEQNKLHDFKLSGKGFILGIAHYNYVDSLNSIQNNELSHFSITGKEGSILGMNIMPSMYGSYKNEILINHNTLLDFNLSQIQPNNYGEIFPLRILSYLKQKITKNRIDSMSIVGNSTKALTIYGIQINIGPIDTTTGLNFVDSNFISNFNVTNSNAQVWGIHNTNLANSNIKMQLSRNNITNLNIIDGSSVNSTVMGIRSYTKSAQNYIYNNLISNLKNSQGQSDSAVVGIFLKDTSKYQVYHNTIYLGADTIISSTNPNFGAQGIAYFNNSLDLRNTIVNVNATPTGNGNVCALRRFATGIQGTSNPYYMPSSNHNIFHTPTQNHSYLIGEGNANTSLINTFDLNTDPQFNSSMSLYKLFLNGADANSYTENNLVIHPNFIIEPPFGGFTGNGGEYLTSVPNDFIGAIRNNPPDIGAMEGNYVTGTTLWCTPRSRFTFYPNPTNEIINIQFTETLPQKTIQYKIVNTKGMVVQEGDEQFNHSNLTIHLHQLPSAIYIIYLHDGNKTLGQTTFHKL